MGHHSTKAAPSSFILRNLCASSYLGAVSCFPLFSCYERDGPFKTVLSITCRNDGRFGFVDFHW